jgi:hypothetical protein
MTAASNIGNAYTNAGQARAGSILGQAGAFNQSLNTLTGFGVSKEGQAAFGKLF